MKLIFSSDQSKEIQISAQIIKLATKDRLSQSAKKFFLFFVLAVLSIFIPVAHFFLVPAFLGISVFIAVKALSFNEKLVLLEKAECLECKKALGPFYLLDKDHRIKCGECFSTYLVQ